MGMYTGIRFKGYVKKEFRDTFEDIAMKGDWDKSDDEVFLAFSKISRATFIPCGSLAYMPDEWETDYINEQGEKEIDFANYYKQVATDGFKRSYDKETGYWTFQCSLKNYESTIQEWFYILPYFIESIEHLEVFYEEWAYSRRYDFVDGQIQEVDDNFIKYGWDDGYR